MAKPVPQPTTVVPINVTISAVNPNIVFLLSFLLRFFVSGTYDTLFILARYLQEKNFLLDYKMRLMGITHGFRRGDFETNMSLSVLILESTVSV